ncbi:MAG: NAD(P)-binding protein [Armatimonadota bacterium]
MLKAHLLDFWLFLRRIWLNAAGILVVLLLSAVYLHGVEAWEEASLLNCFVHSFYMMIGEAVDVPGIWHVDILVFVLPLMGILLAAQGVISATVLFLNKSRREGEWNAIMASTYEDHVVICGLGQLGDALCEGFERAGKQVVAVEIDEESHSVITARRRGVPVIIGDMTEPETLDDANVGGACWVVLCAGDDLGNLEAAMHVNELSPSTTVYARVYKKSLADRISVAMSANIHTFSPYATAAETLLGEINCMEDTEESGT